MRHAWKIPYAGERQQNVSPPYGGVNLPARCAEIFAAAQAAAAQEWRLRCLIGAANVGGTKLGLMLQKPRLPAITWGAHSSAVRNSQSHTTSPAPRFCTAHHGALPKLPAWLADTPRPTAAANPAAANVDLKMIVIAPSLSRRDVGAR